MNLIDIPAITDRIRRHVWVIDSLYDQIRRLEAIRLGVTGPLFLRRPFTLRGQNLFTHKHLIGRTGYGKSNFLAHFVTALIKRGIGVSLIDPHGDLATDCLWHLLDTGYFRNPASQQKLLYIDFGVKDSQGEPTHFLPFNLLKQSFNKYEMADILVDTCRRVWPYLEIQGAPHFENILKFSVVVLMDNNLPLTEIEELLGNKEYREQLLKRVTDPKIISFFHNRFDNWGQDKAKMLEPTLNKTSLLIFSQVLRHSIAQEKNVLNFKELLKNGTSVIFNLAGLTHETQKFLGCLISIGFENAMLSRESIPKHERSHYFLCLDEFPTFSTTSEETFNRFLSEARKYRMWLVLAHQTMSQISPRMQGALQNTQRISFRLERQDAVYMAERFGSFDSDAIRRDAPTPEAKQRILPHEKTVQETYEGWADELEWLYKGEAYIKLESRIEKIKTELFPQRQTPYQTLRKLKASYTNQLMVKREELFLQPSPSSPVPPKPLNIFTARRYGTEEI